jgi:hypothetical protein
MLDIVEEMNSINSMLKSETRQKYIKTTEKNLKKSHDVLTGKSS